MGYLKSDGTKRNMLVTDLQMKDAEGSRLPQGSVVNPQLADPKSALRQKAEEVWRTGGEVELGRIRCLNVGGAFTIWRGCLDYACAGRDHEHVEAKLMERFHTVGRTIAESAVAVVFRDLGAPGTFSNYDGGGAGRGDELVSSPEEFIIRCLEENLGEIGIIPVMPDGFSPTLFYRVEQALRHHEQRLNQRIAAEWEKSYGHNPIATSKDAADILVHVEWCDLPDTMNIEGIGMVSRIRLAVEWHSASVEAGVHSHLTFSYPGRRAENFPRDIRYRLRDLESRDGKALDRGIGVALKVGPYIVVLTYNGGKLDEKMPLVKIAKRREEVHWYGNEKFAGVLQNYAGWHF